MVFCDYNVMLFFVFFVFLEFVNVKKKICDWYNWCLYWDFRNVICYICGVLVLLINCLYFCLFDFIDWYYINIFLLVGIIKDEYYLVLIVLYS